MKYAEKLKDPRWQKKRLKILERDKWQCVKCHDDKSTLHVHHKKYDENKDPWDYPDKQLETLCETCHEKTHAVGVDLERVKKRLVGFLIVNCSIEQKQKYFPVVLALLEKNIVKHPADYAILNAMADLLWAEQGCDLVLIRDRIKRYSLTIDTDYLFSVAKSTIEINEDAFINDLKLLGIKFDA